MTLKKNLLTSILLFPCSAVFAAYPTVPVVYSNDFQPVEEKNMMVVENPTITLADEAAQDFTEPNVDNEEQNIIAEDITDNTDKEETSLDQEITSSDEQTSSPEDDILIHDENVMTFPKVNIYSNKTVDRFIEMYTVRKRKVLITGMQRYAKYTPLMLEIFSQYKLPPELIHLSIVESNFNPKSISKAKAAGIWQFIASTGRLYGLSSNFYIDERFNVEKATHAAANHLRDLFTTFNDWELALAAYNSGTGTVRRAIRYNKARNLPTDFWSLRLPRETRGYLPAFLAINIIIQNPEKYGVPTHYLDLNNKPSFVETQKIVLPPSIHFDQVSKKLNVPKSVLLEFNPEYKMGLTPPENRNFSIQLPAEYDIPNDVYSQFKTDKVPNMMHHKIRKGETFSTIARNYKMSTSALMKLNPRVSSRRLQIGKNLLVAIAVKPKKLIVSYDKSSVYQVAKGDTLKSISDYFGIKLSTLLNLNKSRVSIARPLEIGTVLQIE